MAAAPHLPSKLYAVAAGPLPAPKPKKAIAKENHEREGRIKTKIDQAHRVLNKLEARAAKVSDQISTLRKSKAALEARHQRISDAVLKEMGDARLDRAVGLRVTFTARPAVPSLIVDNESLIPAEYMRERVVSAPDKVAIKEAIVRGAEIQGVHLAVTTSLIRREDR